MLNLGHAVFRSILGKRSLLTSSLFVKPDYCKLWKTANGE